VQTALFKRVLRTVQGDMESYGLPAPEHGLAQAHPTISAELLDRIGHGRVVPKPNVERLMGDRVRFADGSEERIDRIVYATGYRITIPFLDSSLLEAPEDNRMPLFRRVVPPQLSNLYFIGLLQPLGAIMPLAEAQSEWIADVLEGQAALPSPDEMRRVIEREDRRMRKRYVRSPRHTIQVDFYPYMRAIARERRRGRGGRPRRASGAHELRVSTPA
jgi:hypothetical protein